VIRDLVDGQVELVPQGRIFEHLFQNTADPMLLSGAGQTVQAVIQRSPQDPEKVRPVSDSFRLVQAAPEASSGPQQAQDLVEGSG
jgi:hypothetical protein